MGDCLIVSRKTHGRSAAFASSSESRYTYANGERISIILYRKNAGEKIRLGTSHHRYKACRHILFLSTRRVKSLSNGLPQRVLGSGTIYLEAPIRSGWTESAKRHPGERLLVIDDDDALGAI